MKYSSLTNISSQWDYDSFGMLTVGRNWSGGSEFRYGFNGKENEDEIAGNNNDLDFGARIYDSRLGKWFSPDKFQATYPSNSTYSYCLNNPIYLVDKNGDNIFIFDSQNKLVAVIEVYKETDIAIKFDYLQVPKGFPILNIGKGRHRNHDAYFIDIAADLSTIPGLDKYPINPADFKAGIEIVIFMYGPQKYTPMLFGFVEMGVTTPGGFGTSSLTGIGGVLGYADIECDNCHTLDRDNVSEFSDPHIWEGLDLYGTELKPKKPHKGISGQYFHTTSLDPGPKWKGHGKASDGLEISVGFARSVYIKTVGGTTEKTNEIKTIIDKWNNEYYGGGSNSKENDTDFLEKNPDRVEYKTSSE